MVCGLIYIEAYEMAKVSHITDVKLQLSATDYGNFLANEPSPLQTSTISAKATERMVEEFNFIRSNAEGELRKFLEYMTYVLLML